MANSVQRLVRASALPAVLLAGASLDAQSPAPRASAALSATSSATPSADTMFLEVGSPQVDGRIYRPHKARVQVRLGAPDGPVVSEWTNELTLGDSAGRAVARWVTIGTQMPVNGFRTTWEIRQTFDARTLQPLAYDRVGGLGGMARLAINGTSVRGQTRMNAATETVEVDRTLDRPGFVDSASDLVPLAVGLRSGAVMVAPFWGPQMTATERRIFTVVGREPRVVEGKDWSVWRVEERRYEDRVLLATWFLVDSAPYMVAGEVPMPNGQIRYMTEITIP